MAVIRRDYIPPKPKKNRATKKKAAKPEATRGERMRTGKGWRLGNPGTDGKFTNH